MTAAGAHPPTHVLAELAEGVLDDAPAREVRAHADQCLTCQASLDELAQVSVALRALPAELPVPEFVAARISHALAAERSSGGTAGASGSPERSGANGGTVAWFRRRLPQGLAAAASVAVVGLAGYVVVSGGAGGDDSDNGDSGAEVAAGQAAPEDATTLDSRAQPPADGGDAEQNETYSTMDELATPNRVDARALTAAVEDIVSERPTGGPNCGRELSDELGQAIVGAESFAAGVLIVLEGTDTYDGWLLDTCHSVSTATIEPQVQIPKAE